MRAEEKQWVEEMKARCEAIVEEMKARCEPIVEEIAFLLSRAQPGGWGRLDEEEMSTLYHHLREVQRSLRFETWRRWHGEETRWSKITNRVPVSAPLDAEEDQP